MPHVASQAQPPPTKSRATGIKQGQEPCNQQSRTYQNQHAQGQSQARLVAFRWLGPIHGLVGTPKQNRHPKKRKAMRHGRLVDQVIPQIGSSHQHPEGQPHHPRTPKGTQPGTKHPQTQTTPNESGQRNGRLVRPAKTIGLKTQNRSQKMGHSKKRTDHQGHPHRGLDNPVTIGRYFGPIPMPMQLDIRTIRILHKG